ncbi:response regulator transcription factor [Negadavirga shengliensis]|uniref:Response regulator transcription factor n=1 Tax=Negadavirga shengliensis TaxID=1389218 RepID=A0ABV9T5D8_9BACT
METLTSIINQQYQNLIKYDRLLTSRSKTIEEIGELCNEIFYHSDENFHYLYLNEQGCDWFGMSNEDILKIKGSFLEKFYHPHTLHFELPKIKRFFKPNSRNLVYSNCLQIFNPAMQSYSICLVFMKKFNGSCGYISFIMPIENLQGISKKVRRILSEEHFKHSHKKDFDDLTSRETEILKLLARGSNNPQISDQLFISRRTVEQHRKNINRKLQIKSFRDILSYAYAFDLV